MKKKWNLLTIVIFSFLFPFCFGNIIFVKSAGKISISSNGSVIGTDNILREGNSYTFVSNIQGSIIVEKIVLLSMDKVSLFKVQIIRAMELNLLEEMG